LLRALLGAGDLDLFMMDLIFEKKPARCCLESLMIMPAEERALELEEGSGCLGIFSGLASSESSDRFVAWTTVSFLTESLLEPLALRE
jgi:hypothetical protein